MNQIKRYGFMGIFLTGGLLIAVSAFAAHSETTIGGKVDDVDTADQSFKLNATPKNLPAGSAEVNVTSKTNFVGMDSLADLKSGDEVQVDSSKSASGEVKAETVTKV